MEERYEKGTEKSKETKSDTKIFENHDAPVFHFYGFYVDRGKRISDKVQTYGGSSD
jgi:hypothetical protein